MLRSLNSGISGLKAHQTKLDVIGNNIANVNTTGFKKSTVVFEEVVSQTIKDATAPGEGTNGGNTIPVGGLNPLQVGLGTRVASIENNFTTGSPTITNKTTDLFIDGNGFFTVQDGKGSTYYTRAGNFSLDGDMNIVNPDGMVVLDTEGEAINLEGFISFTVGINGNVIGISSDGTVENTGQTLGIVSVTNPSGLKKFGSSLYALTDNTQIIEEQSDSKIIAGQLEMSNVDLTEEMTEMIIAQRGLQANSKIITVSDQILEEIINLKR